MVRDPYQGDGIPRIGDLRGWDGWDVCICIPPGWDPGIGWEYACWIVLPGMCIGVSPQLDALPSLPTASHCSIQDHHEAQLLPI